MHQSVFCVFDMYKITNTCLLFILKVVDENFDSGDSAHVDEAGNVVGDLVVSSQVSTFYKCLDKFVTIYII